MLSAQAEHVVIGHKRRVPDQVYPKTKQPQLIALPLRIQMPHMLPPAHLCGLVSSSSVSGATLPRQGYGLLRTAAQLDRDVHGRPPHCAGSAPATYRRSLG